MVWSAFLPKNASQSPSIQLSGTIALTMHMGNEDLGHFASSGPVPSWRLQLELSGRALRAIDHWMSKGRKETRRQFRSIRSRV